MSVREVTFFEVACDFEGCEIGTADLGDYAAWADDAQAIESWTDAGCTYDWDTKATFCGYHTPRCPGCEIPLADDEHEDDCPNAPKEVEA